jgi:hypothetical protein
MEAIRLLNGTTRRSFLGTLALGMLFALSGCDTTSVFVLSDVPKCTEPPCQVVAWWHRNVVTAADSMNNGAPVIGIAGRVYLYNLENKPVVGDGELVVGLFDDTPHPGTAGPVEVHEWKIDPETLKRLLKEDAIGWGYTLFLPWPDNRPVLKQIQLKVRYNQPNKAPLFCESGPLTLEGPPAPNQPPQVTHAMKPGSR